MSTEQEIPFNILVVDDEPDLELLVRQRMRPEIRSGKYVFSFAANGVEALQSLRENHAIDMVVSDINMPQMDGLSLLEHIPSVNPEVKYIIVSAYGDMRNIRTAMNRGAFDFVIKPLDFEDFRITIERTKSHLAEWKDARDSRDKLMTLQSELDVASNMQQSILPTIFPKGDDYEIHGTMMPARNVGGDFFDIIPLELNRIGLAVADVSDKGIPAALFMMSSRTLLKGTAIGLATPGKVLTELNSILHDDNKTTMFVTMLYALYEPDTGVFSYSNGGHCNPIVIHSNGDCSELSTTDGVVLGVVPELEYVEKSAIIRPGETVIMYSDGVSEATNSQGEEFGLERLFRAFGGQAPRSAEEANERILAAVAEFAGETSQSDDVTCLALHRRET